MAPRQDAPGRELKLAEQESSLARGVHGPCIPRRKPGDAWPCSVSQRSARPAVSHILGAPLPQATCLPHDASYCAAIQLELGLIGIQIVAVLVQGYKACYYQREEDSLHPILPRAGHAYHGKQPFQDEEPRELAA